MSAPEAQPVAGTLSTSIAELMDIGDRFAYRPELAELVFEAATLMGVLDLRQEAILGQTGRTTAAKSATEAAQTLVGNIRLLAERLKLAKAIVFPVIADIEASLALHLSRPAYRDPWRALVGGSQAAADHLALSLADTTESLADLLEVLKQEGATDAESLRTVEGLTNTIANFKVILLAADQPGEMIRA